MSTCLCGHVCVGVSRDPRAWLRAGIGERATDALARLWLIIFNLKTLIHKQLMEYSLLS